MGKGIEVGETMEMIWGCGEFIGRGGGYVAWGSRGSMKMEKRKGS